MTFARLLLLAAILFRGLLPTGYMPDLSGEGGFSLTICDGGAHEPAMAELAKELGLAFQTGEDEEAVPASPCPYAVAGAIILPVAPERAEPAPRAPPRSLPLPSSETLRTWRVRPPLPPRSPPFLG